MTGSALSSIHRSVWTLWTVPFQAHHKAVWLSEKHHLLSWILSVETARQHYPDTRLITDDTGAELLVQGLGLSFNTVSTELNALKHHDPEWWVMGKLYAYRSQTQPFVHLDNDVFLWNPLPDRLTTAPVFAQNPEDFPFASGCWYRPEVYDQSLRSSDTWIPAEWSWYVANQGNQAVCCGLLGGNHTDFIAYYADQAIAFIEHPQNQWVWSLIHDKIGDNILFEQYFLFCCLDYHRHHATSLYHDVTIEYLFASADDAFTPDRATEAGYTHLIGGAKRNQDLCDRLEKRVARDYPSQYARCLQYLDQITTSGAGRKSKF